MSKKKSNQQEKGRKCQKCGKALSRYNKKEVCFAHQKGYAGGRGGYRPPQPIRGLGSGGK